jgi:hypothetical protein
MRCGFLFFVLIFFVFLNVVSAGASVLLSDQGTGVKFKSTGEVVGSADIRVEIYDNLINGSLVYSETFVGGIINGQWNLMLGENPAIPLVLEYGKRYYRDYKINGIDVDFRDYLGGVVEMQAFDSPIGTVPSAGHFVGKTNSSYTADLSFGNTSGYDAANKICYSEYLGSHLCSEFELIGAIAAMDISSVSFWEGAAWVFAGGAKYSPADTPANDCNGFTHGVPGSFLGTFWIFEKPNGGKSALGHCGNNFALACCR